MGMFIWLLFLLSLQVGIRFVLTYLGLSYIVVELIIDLILAFLFSFVSYRGVKKDAIKDVNFHKNVAIYFVILIVFSLLWGLL